MAQQQQKDMSGVLFRNNKKQKDSHPDYVGTCTIGGEELQISAWLKESSKGTKYMSLAFSEPYQKDAPKSDSVQSSPMDSLDSDIPF